MTICKHGEIPEKTDICTLCLSGEIEVLKLTKAAIFKRLTEAMILAKNLGQDKIYGFLKYGGDAYCSKPASREHVGGNCPTCGTHDVNLPRFNPSTLDYLAHGDPE